jgi:hypothetical protein
MVHWKTATVFNSFISVAWIELANVLNISPFYQPRIQHIGNHIFWWRNGTRGLRNSQYWFCAPRRKHKYTYILDVLCAPVTGTLQERSLPSGKKENLLIRNRHLRRWNVIFKRDPPACGLLSEPHADACNFIPISESNTKWMNAFLIQRPVSLWAVSMRIAHASIRPHLHCTQWHTPQQSCLLRG